MAFTIEHMDNLEACYYLFVYSLIFMSVWLLAFILIYKVIYPASKLTIFGYVATAQRKKIRLETSSKTRRPRSCAFRV